MSRIKVTIKNYKTPQKIAEYVLLLLISAIFLMLFSLWTSPFYTNWYGCDASFFTLVGRGILNGKVMYRDFYDLKGPYFFFIEALGQLICKGRTGAFIIQLAALFASSALIWNTCQLFVSKSKSAFILFVFYMCHITTLWGGNTLEEFMLTFSLLCLYLTCHLHKTTAIFKMTVSKGSLAENPDSQSIPAYLPTILGCSFGIMIFSKITVSGCVLGITAGIIFILIRNKRINELILFIIYFIMGILIVSLPMIIYFSVSGCLMDMLKCVFIIGFRRSKDFAEIFNINWELKCSGAVFAFIFAVTHRKRCSYPLCVILLAMSAATYILFHLGTPFYYYFTSAYPCIILALCLMLSAYDPLIIFESPKQAVCMLVFAVYLLYYIPASLGTLRTVIYDRQDPFYQTYVDDSKELASFIPDVQQDSVFSFMLDMQWYEINGILPCNRYIVNLPFFLVLDENAYDEVSEYLDKTPPKWLVIGHNFDAELHDIAKQVNQKYTCVYDNSVGYLYLLDE